MAARNAATGETRWTVDGANFWGGYLQFPVVPDDTVVRTRSEEIDAEFRSLRGGQVQRALSTPYLYPVLTEGEPYTLQYPAGAITAYE